MNRFLVISVLLQSTFSFATAACGRNITNEFNGTITSPGYPTPGYDFGLDCEWKITVQPGSKISLKFKEVNIKSTGGGDSGCGPNSVSVNYVGLMIDLIYCTQNQPQSIIESKGNVMEIKFVSTRNETDRSKGFSATFTTILPVTTTTTTTTNATTNATTTAKPTIAPKNTTTVAPRNTTTTASAPVTKAPKKGISKGGVAVICIVVILVVLLIIDLILYQKNMGVIYTIKKSCCGGYAAVSKS